MERKAACILLQDARGLLYLLLFLSSNREMSDKLLELHRHLGERLAGRGDVFLGVLLLLDGGRDGGGVGRLLGELADFVGDDGEAAAVLASAGGLDGGVQRQEVRLLGDARDRADDLLDVFGVMAELDDGRARAVDAVADAAHLPDGLRERCAVAVHRVDAGLVFCERFEGEALHAADGAVDAADGRRGVVDMAFLLLDAHGHLADGLGDVVHVLERLLGCARELFARGGQRLARAADFYVGLRW